MARRRSNMWHLCAALSLSSFLQLVYNGNGNASRLPPLVHWATALPLPLLVLLLHWPPPSSPATGLWSAACSTAQHEETELASWTLNCLRSAACVLLLVTFAVVIVIVIVAVVVPLPLPSVACCGRCFPLFLWPVAVFLCTGLRCY